MTRLSPAAVTSTEARGKATAYESANAPSTPEPWVEDRRSDSHEISNSGGGVTRRRLPHHALGET